MDRTEWLEARRRGIGGSDAAAILGLSPFRTPVDVWCDKLGLSPVTPQTPAMEWGLRLEDAIARAFADATGARVRKTSPIRRARHVTAFPMLGSLDRLAFGDVPAVSVLELKHPRSDDGLGDPDGPPEQRVPPAWYCQVQHYLEVVPEAETGFVAALVGGSDFRIVEVPRDPDFARDMLEEEERFWRTYVVPRVRPPVTGDDLAFLSRAFPRDDGAEVVATPEASLLVESWLEADARARRAERDKDEARARIEDLMGTAARLLSPAGTVSWKARDQDYTKWKELASLYRMAIERELRAVDTNDLPETMLPAVSDLDAMAAEMTETKIVRPFLVKPPKEGER